MHIFIVHQFPDLDTFAPVIFQINKKNKIRKADILSIYPVQDIKKYNLTKFLIKNSKIKIFSLADINIRNIFLILFLKFLFLVPKFILKRLYRFWYYLYHEANLITHKGVEKFIKKYKIKTITIDDTLQEKYKKIFFKTCSKMNIKLIQHRTGVEMRKVFSVPDEALLCSHNFIANDLKAGNNIAYDKVKDKMAVLNSARYSLEWIEILEYINNFKLKDYIQYPKNDDKLKICIFTRNQFHISEWENIKKKIESIDNVEVKLKYKPRGDLSPLNINRQTVNQLTSSELINWADIIISHASSILIEAFLKNKIVFFPEYLLKDKKYICSNYDVSKENYYIEDFNCVVNINSLEDMIDKINSFDKYDTEWKNNLKIGQKSYLEKMFGENFQSNNSLDENADYYLKLKNLI